MITLQQATLHLGDKILLDKADLTLFKGQKVGFIGKNGCGKSSLFRVLLGELHLESGELSLPKQLTLTHLEQAMPDSEETTLTYTLQGNQQITALKAQLTIAEKMNDGMAIAHLHNQLIELGEYEAESKAAKVLIGLGFTQDGLSKPVNAFSGGWRMRLNLARALLANSELLLLDEPTNHLDFEAILWLEQWLKDSTQTILLVSHDRDLLDQVATHIVELDRQTLRLWQGNYSAFQQQKQLQQQVQQAAYLKQQQTKQHLEKFIARFRAKASKAKQAQSRMKQLEKMQFVEQPFDSAPFQFDFYEAKDIGNPVISLREVDIQYANQQPILQNIFFSLNQGDRIGLLGPNGAGKSTFIKLLAQTLPPACGEALFNSKANIGYFNQDLVKQLDLTATAFDHLQALDTRLTAAQVRQYLGRFHFHGDEVFRQVNLFSGGEKVRLALAMLVFSKPNVLLLDEPTNHLDMEMREALNFALQNFAGSLVVVSHDRFFLSSVCDDFYLVYGGKVQPFKGDLQDYHQWILQQSQITAAVTDKENAKPANTTPSVEAPRPSLKRLQQQMTKLEQKLVEAVQNLKVIDAQLNDPALYQSDQLERVAVLSTHREQQVVLVNKLEEELLAFMQEMEA